MATPNKRTALVCAGLAVCNVLIATTALAQDVSFVARRDFDAGTRPNSVAPGDFNGDGVQDLAVANSGSNNVSVLLGNGDGSFQAARNFAVGNTPVSVAVGDFNGDGVLDLAAANAGSDVCVEYSKKGYCIRYEHRGGSTSVLLGQRDGTFGSAVIVNGGISPAFIVTADFNGDGVLDLGGRRLE